MTYTEVAAKYGKIKPILFSTPMVQAILDGRKTQTRRVADNSKMPPKDADTKYIFELHEWNPRRIKYLGYSKYHIGDILWVRETWVKSDGAELPEGFYYLANPKDATAVNRNWRPSIHMPRDAARIFLRVKNVRIERLHEINEADAKYEGVLPIDPFSLPQLPTSLFEPGGMYGKGYLLKNSYRAAFYQLWETLNAKRGYGWNTNPYVWVIEFENISEEAKL